MTQSDANSNFSLYVKRAKELGDRLIDLAEQSETPLDVTVTDAENLATELEDIKGDISGLLDDVDENLVNEEIEPDVEEELEEDGDVPETDDDPDYHDIDDERQSEGKE